MSLKGWFIGAAVAVALVSGGALVMVTGAGAQEEDGAGAGRRGIAERVAEKLGVDVTALRDAFKSARLDIVNEALESRKITEEQAAKARERIEEGKPLRGRAHHAAVRVRHAIVESAATALGMTPDELRAELMAGKSIADVATERGVSIDDVKAQITSDAEAKLAELVAEGRIDQARADAALAKLNERLDEIVERSRE